MNGGPFGRAGKELGEAADYCILLVMVNGGAAGREVM